MYVFFEVIMKVEYVGSVSWVFVILGILMGVVILFFWVGCNRFVYVFLLYFGKFGWLDLVVGFVLFGVIVILIWGYEFIYSWLMEVGVKEVLFFMEWGVIGVMCLGCFVVFLVIFLMW